mmetsp:Transcript_89044/g.191071  ORF Transcript_89044/g.191071 Transcript_89044/m.191071 type:complete len:359 (-) Transcript_89044:52-1128(-)
MAAKAAAAAALQRAEAAACKAVAEAGLEGPGPGLRTGGRCPGAHRRSGGALHVGADRRSASDAPWDPLGGSERLAQYLRASNQLHSAGGKLQDRRSNEEEHLARLDRQLAEVEKTRALISAVLGGHQGKTPRSAAPQGEGARANAALVRLETSCPSLPSTAGVACDGRGTPPQGEAAAPKPPRPASLLALPAAAGPPPRSSGGAGAGPPAAAPTAAPAAAPGRPLQRRQVAAAAAARTLSPASGGSSGSTAWCTVELRPAPCPPELVGTDCPCCLGVMREADLTLAFPCPARHSFHAGCLQRWLRAAGANTTCPMCRAWPRGRRRAGGEDAALRRVAPSAAVGAVPTRRPPLPIAEGP